MSLVFQPRPTSMATAGVATTPSKPIVMPHDPPTVLRAAVEALALGDGSRLQRIFTDDVQFRSPHVSVRPLSETHVPVMMSKAEEFRATR